MNKITRDTQVTPPISTEGNDASQNIEKSSSSQSQIESVAPSHEVLQSRDHNIPFSRAKNDGSSISNHKITEATAAAAHAGASLGTAVAHDAAAVARATGGVAVATTEGAALGALVGAAHGALFHYLDRVGGVDEVDRAYDSITGDRGSSRFNAGVRGTLIGGAVAGASIAFISSLLGPAALGVGVVTHPRTWGFYGAAIGGLIGSVGSGVGFIIRLATKIMKVAFAIQSCTAYFIQCSRDRRIFLGELKSLSSRLQVQLQEVLPLALFMELILISSAA